VLSPRKRDVTIFKTLEKKNEEQEVWRDEVLRVYELRMPDSP
jgi:hypothetical protein